MGRLVIQDLIRQEDSAQDDSCPRTISPISAATIPSAPSTASGLATTSRSAGASARPATACYTATPARPGSPSSRGRPSSTPNSRTTKSWRSSNISTRAAASARRHAWSGSTRTRSRDWPSWPDNTPRMPTTTSWLFPPETREVQFDEKWSFVFKKEKNCDPADPEDAHRGDYWDHVAFDPEHKLVLEVIPGARTI